MYEQHGDSTSKEWLAWKNARKDHPMIDEWKCSYPVFLEYMGRAPSVLHRLRRRDAEKPFGPGNAEWYSLDDEVGCIQGGFRITGIFRKGGRTYKNCECVSCGDQRETRFESRLKQCKCQCLKRDPIDQAIYRCYCIVHNRAYRRKKPVPWVDDYLYRMISKMRNRRENPNGGRIPSIGEFREMLAQQRYRCAISGIALNESNMSIDHRVAVSKGGTDDIENLQFVDKTINFMKGNLDQQEFVAMCCLVAKKSRQRRHRNNGKDASQLNLLFESDAQK